MMEFRRKTMMAVGNLIIDGKAVGKRLVQKFKRGRRWNSDGRAKICFQNLSYYIFFLLHFIDRWKAWFSWLACHLVNEGSPVRNPPGPIVFLLFLCFFLFFVFLCLGQITIGPGPCAITFHTPAF